MVVLCEIILITVSCGSIVILISMACAFKKIINQFTKEINTLTKEVNNQTERIKKIQLKVLSLNEISGLNV